MNDTSYLVISQEAGENFIYNKVYYDNLPYTINIGDNNNIYVDCSGNLTKEHIEMFNKAYEKCGIPSANIIDMLHFYCMIKGIEIELKAYCDTDEYATAFVDHMVCFPALYNKMLFFIEKNTLECLSLSAFKQKDFCLKFDSDNELFIGNECAYIYSNRFIDEDGTYVDECANFDNSKWKTFNDCRVYVDSKVIILAKQTDYEKNSNCYKCSCYFNDDLSKMEIEKLNEQLNIGI